MSPARQHRDRCLAASQPASAPAEGSGTAFAATDPAAIAAAQVAMRLTHDRRRLKEIQSIERKIDAKREMLPEYAAWIDGMLAAAAETGQGVQGEVLPTVMLWRIDTGDYAGALPLADYVLRHDIGLPPHFERTAPTLIAEEIAGAALKLLVDRKPFGLDLLLEVEELVADHDMPDEVRAKLAKAIGFEYALRAVPDDGNGVAGAERAARTIAIQRLRRALDLDGRSGVKTQLAALEKALAKDPDQGGTAPPPATAGDDQGATPPDDAG